jgi:type I restriction enzyme R subunit
MEELAELAWELKDGKQIAPGSGERESWSELIIPRRLREAIAAVNPALPAPAVEDAVQIVLTAASRDARAENLRMHEFLTRGIRSVTFTDS